MSDDDDDELDLAPEDDPELLLDADDPKPPPPTREQIAAFEAWKARWTVALAEGNDQGWLEYEGYDGPPEPITGLEWQHSREMWDWEQRARHRRTNANDLKRAQLLDRAEKAAAQAAEKARAKVLREGR